MTGSKASGEVEAKGPDAEPGPAIAPDPWRPERIDDSTIAAVRKALRSGAPVHVALPSGGRLYIDRPLPFLVVYRGTGREESAALVGCSASHLITEDPEFDPRPLVRAVAEEVSERIGGLLLIEVWDVPGEAAGEPGARLVPPACFAVHPGPIPPPVEVIDALEASLGEISLARAPSVSVEEGEAWAPLDLAGLLDPDDAEPLGVHALGLEVAAIYRDPESCDVFPRVLRRVAAGVDRAIKEAAVRYARARTVHEPRSWRELGRTLVAQADWDADRRLTEIAGRFDFLLAVSPVDADESWEAFRDGGYATPPTFRYRPLTFDPEEAKAELYGIDLSGVSDPTLADLFRQQRAALGIQLSMLEARNTPAFLYTSMQLYGGVEDELLRLAEGLLEAIRPVPEVKKTEGGSSGGSEDSDDEVEEVGNDPGRREKGRLDCYAFAERARAELDHYRAAYPALTSTVEVRDDISGLMVSRGNLMIGEGLSVAETRVEALIQHEVGTHIVTWINGSAQPLKQLFAGLAGYDELQEGLAVLAEYLVGGLTRARLRLLAARVLAVRRMIDGADFLDVWRELTDAARLSKRAAFTAAMRVFRSGGLTKDAVYLRGLVRLLRHLEDGGELEPFFIGKITPDHASDIADLQARGVLRPPPLVPRWVTMDGASERLDAIRQGMSVVDLVPRRAW